MSSNYVAIALRILAIVFFFRGLKEIASVIQFALVGQDAGMGFSSWSYLFIALTIWLFSFVAWFFAVPISKRITYGSLDFKVEPVTSLPLIAVFVSVIGVYVFSYGLIDSVYYLSMHILGRDADAFDITYRIETQSNIVATILEVVLGLGLILKSRTIAKIINEVSK